MVAVGLFKNTDDLTLDLQVFIDEKPVFYSFAEKTKMMTAAEIFAMYGGQE